MASIGMILASVLLNSVAQVCMKKGMSGIGEITNGIQGLVVALPQIIMNLSLWVSGICYVLSFALWLIVLSRVEVSYAYPFLSIGYVFTAVVGYFAFGEAVTPVRIAGILVICVGVVLISRS